MTNKLKGLREYFAWFGLRGVLLSLYSWAANTQLVFSVSVPGLKHPVHLRTRTTDKGAYDEVLIRHAYDVELPRKPAVIVDAGANIGLTSVYFANRYPDARIYAIEPSASNYAALVRNTAPYPNIVPIHAALWHEESNLTLLDPGLGQLGYQITNQTARQADTVEESVPATTIDRLMADHGIDAIDLLKIDIEGSEKEVFEHAAGWIGRVGAIIIEIHDRLKPGCRRAFDNATPDFDQEDFKAGHLIKVRRNFSPAR